MKKNFFLKNKERKVGVGEILVFYVKQVYICMKRIFDGGIISIL